MGRPAARETARVIGRPLARASRSKALSTSAADSRGVPEFESARYNWCMTYVDLQRRLHDNPFRALRIRMVNSSTYDILEPWMVMVGETSAVIATQTRKDDRGFEVAMDWKTVSIAHMLELSDLNPPKSSGRQKRAS